jgi:glycosyltransferase involved in cell wall biosynthesis
VIFGIKATQIGRGGGLTHLVQCLLWFGKLAPQDQFILYGHTDQKDWLPPAPPNVTYRLYQAPARGLMARLVWEGTRLPQLMAKDHLDVLLEPGNYAAPHSPCPNVTLIHNLAPFVPEYVKRVGLYQKLRLTALKRLTLKAVATSSGTIFISDYARRIISPMVQGPARPATVIYHGAAEVQSGTLGHVEDSHVPTFVQGSILCVSHIYRYKGILELVQGYATALAKDSHIPDLVIVGDWYDKPYVAEIQEFLATHGIGDRVRLTGTVPEQQLHDYYRACRFFVFPSTIENCPNILLEALAAGCAIATSDCGVMPEICSHAARYFDPRSTDGISEALLSLNGNEPLLQALREQATARARQFSWRETADRTLCFLREVGHANVIPATRRRSHTPFETFS